MSKQKRDGNTYKRYDCIFAVEGGINPEQLRMILTGEDAEFEINSRRNMALHGKGYQPVGGPYKNIPREQINGNIVLLTPADIQVHVFNGRAHLSQKLLSVYKENGTITEQEIGRLEQRGQHIVDSLGTVEIVRDRQGNPIARHITGRGKPEVMNGEVVFVRDAKANEPLESSFIVDLLGQSENDNDLIPIAINPISGEPMDSIMPDGSAGFGMGRHDHVVLVLKTLERILKGTKAEMLAKNGILDSVLQDMPDEIENIDKIRVEIEAHDPSNGILVASLPEYKVMTIPLNSFYQ